MSVRQKIRFLEVRPMSEKSDYDYSPSLDDDVIDRGPGQFEVLLHNDDYTTMEFVTYILMRYFGKNGAMAEQIMMKVHETGQAVCGTYSKDIAETKVSQVRRDSKENGHPLRCTMREVD